MEHTLGRDFFAPTKAIRAYFQDGTSQLFIFDSDRPVMEWEVAPDVPFIPAGTQTAGPLELYERPQFMMLNQAKLLKRVGKEAPPRKQQTCVPPPRVGDVVGFISGLEMRFAGISYPASKSMPSWGVHMFSIDKYMVVSLSQIMPILERGAYDGQKMVTLNIHYVREKLSSAKTSFTITPMPDAVFDTLFLVKMLGAIDKKSPKQSFIRTETIDCLVGEFGRGGIMMDWIIRKE